MRKRNILLIGLILLVGTRASARFLKPVRGPVSKISKHHHVMRVKVTAYTSSADECGNNLGITASGEPASDGTLACNFLPFGTKVRIPKLFGRKEFTVKDRMSKCKHGFVDVWVETKKTAFKIGKRSLNVVILG